MRMWPALPTPHTGRQSSSHCVFCSVLCTERQQIVWILSRNILPSVTMFKGVVLVRGEQRPLFLSHFSFLMKKKKNGFMRCPCCLCRKQALNCHEICYELHAIGGYSKVALFSFLQSVITTWRTHEFVRLERHYDHQIYGIGCWNYVWW